MLSANGRYAIMLNGEIYNAADIRAEIEASGATHIWRGHCDTEVLVEAVAIWGVEGSGLPQQRHVCDCRLGSA